VTLLRYENNILISRNFA